MDNLFTPQKAALIKLAFENFLPAAVIKINKAKGTVAISEVDSVTANIQGPLSGGILSSIVDTVGITKRTFTIYRSGTGLTIKFS